MKFKYVITVFVSVIVGFLTIPINQAQAIDTGDGFLPRPMCSEAEPSAYQPEIRQGHYGLNVELAQALLGITNDGCFGPGTHQAVIDFQVCQGLYVDGLIGKQTWSALDSGKTLAGCNRNVQLFTVKVPTNSEKSVEIDQWREVVRLKIGDSVIDTMPMIDNHEVLTKGKYTVCGFHRTNYDVSLTWLLPNFVRLCDADGENTRKGFHAIPVSTKSGALMHDDSFLGTGKKMSSGCIRLSLVDSQVLWDFATSGMKVVVK